MSLDLSQVVPQISGMVERLHASNGDRLRRLESARELLRASAAKPEELQRKVASGKTTWLVPAMTGEGLAMGVPAPSAPADFQVIATDGSHMDTDRHRDTPCYLINTGSVTLGYGSDPYAVLVSSAVLYYQEQDLVMASPDGLHDQRVEGAVLGARRGIEEAHAVVNAAASLRSDHPAVALLDGSLIMWELEGDRYPEFVVRALVDEGFIKCLNDIAAIAARRRLALASYISSPQAKDVAGLMRVALCPHDPVDCDRHCTGRVKEDKKCHEMAGLADAEILAGVLRDGERSAAFLSRSRVVGKRYGDNAVHFFYVKAGGEVARVEVPQWVALKPDLLGLVHAVVLDQCRRGDGYPAALSEAHEKAVLTGSDREQFWSVVDRAMAGHGAMRRESAKSLSKRRPWV